jgi:hypothetical protein
MKQDVAERWITALESEEFPQAKDALRRNDGYCCLGVLCELYRREHPDRASWDEKARDRGIIAFNVSGEQGFSVLPDEVLVWAGMRFDNGHFGGGFPGIDGDTLAELNDSDEPFTRIAQVIRDYVEKL